MMAAGEPLAFPAEAGSMGRMDDWLAAFAAAHGLPPETREELRVCLHELSANVIMHGGRDGGPRTIEISGRMDGDRVVLEFADDAPAFDPLSREAPPAKGKLEDVAIGGLGLHLVRSFTDELTYRRTPGRNHLTLVRKPR